MVIDRECDKVAIHIPVFGMFCCCFRDFFETVGGGVGEVQYSGAALVDDQDHSTRGGVKHTQGDFIDQMPLFLYFV